MPGCLRWTDPAARRARALSEGVGTAIMAPNPRSLLRPGARSAVAMLIERIP